MRKLKPRRAPVPSIRSPSLEEMPDGRLFYEAYYRHYLARDLEGAIVAYETLIARNGARYYFPACMQLLELYRDTLRVDAIVSLLTKMADGPRFKRQRARKRLLGAIRTIKASKKRYMARVRKQLERLGSSSGKSADPTHSTEREKMREELFKALAELRRSPLRRMGFLVPQASSVWDETVFGPGPDARTIQQRRVELSREIHAEQTKLKVQREQGNSARAKAVRERISRLRMEQARLIHHGRQGVVMHIRRLERLAQRYRRSGETAMEKKTRERIRKLEESLPKGLRGFHGAISVLPRLIRRLELEGKSKEARIARKTQRELERMQARGEWKQAQSYIRAQVKKHQWLLRALRGWASR